MSGKTYFSIQTYNHPGGSGITFTVPFPFIRKDDVAVYIGGEAVPASDYRWVSDGEIRIIPEVSMGLPVVFRRFTRRDRRWAEYHDGSMLSENDLNIVTRQLLYINQELYDYLVAADDPNPPPGGVGNPGGGGEDNTDPDYIDEIIEELLNSQLFKNLTEAIAFIDINAESVMSSLLQNHERWAEDRRFGGLLRTLDAGLKDVDARVLEITETVITDTEALIDDLKALQVRFTDSEADLVEYKRLVANQHEALTEAIGVQESRVDDAFSRIGNVERTYATREYTESYVQQQLSSAFAPESLSGFLNATEVIQGIKTRADRDLASLESVASYLVGSGFRRNPDGSIDWLTPGNGSLAHSVSGLQQTVKSHASQLSTELQYRQALASRYSPGNANNPAALVSAMEQSWKTYADKHSTTSQRVTTLESNRQPVFFRSAAPNWTTSEFEGTPWATDGFPEGSVWYREISSGFYVPYHWKLVSSHPTSGYSYGNFGPYGGKPGMWIEVRNRATTDAVAALAQTVEQTYVKQGEVGAIVNTQLQTALGPNYQTIDERLESWINSSSGVMYSGWQVRINQTGASGVPVIAGIGLGMQSDPNNPRRSSVSSMIVMADRFAVVRPPSGSDYINGKVDTSKQVVPFVIDADTGTVGINGKLIVRGSLSAYDGAVGRLVVTQLNSAGNPVSDTGMRLVLPSSSNNWNASPGRSPFPGGSNPQRYLLWAGTGTMNHNNAVFYVDTDGNGKFEGEVDAKNIVGTVNDTVAINEIFSDQTVPNGADWITLPGTPELPQVTRQRRATAIVAIHSMGRGATAGRARLRMRHNGTGTWSQWYEVANSTIAQPTATTITLAGVLPSMTAGRVQLQVDLGSAPGQSGGTSYPTSTRYSGIMMGIR